MNTTPDSARALAMQIVNTSNSYKDIRRVICPPTVSLTTVANAVNGSSIAIGAQNIYYQESGEFTGEVSAKMLEGIAEFVIVGHSERRRLFGESNSDIAKKAIIATKYGITPIVCVGETSEVKISKKAHAFVAEQTKASLAGFTAWNKLVIAYEPVWAIGTGISPTPMQVQDMSNNIRETLHSVAGELNVSIQVVYGGSVNANSAGPFLDRQGIDGLLIGKASLNAQEFTKITDIAQTVYDTTEH